MSTVTSQAIEDSLKQCMDPEDPHNIVEMGLIYGIDVTQNNISCINIAPGPINTDRTKELIDNIEEFKKTLPMKRLGEPEEIGNFVKAIVENKVKYLSGVTINFDGANSNYIF